MKPQLLTTTIPADVRGWWASEKYDGVRAIWNGRLLHYRSGRAINAPEWFTRGLPAGIRLDGELWMGRGKFDDLVSAIQKKGSDWNGIRFMIFDLADVGGFEERLIRLNETAPRLPDWAWMATHRLIRSHAHLDRLEREIVDAGGEGLVIRRPRSEYRPGRSEDTIKVKRLTPDIERWQG
jgi:DNA ligase 1